MSVLRLLKPNEWPGASAGSGPYRHLYVIQEGNDGPVKIGVAANAACRRVSLQAGNPRPIVLRAVFVCENKPRAGAMERAVHAHFADARVVNEWFDVTPEVVRDFILENFC